MNKKKAHPQEKNLQTKKKNGEEDSNEKQIKK